MVKIIYKLSLLFSIFTLPNWAFSNTSTQARVVDSENGVHILEVDSELNYFINGSIELSNKDGKKDSLSILDTNNANDVILVKGALKETGDSCQKVGCLGLPSKHEIKTRDKNREKNNKSLFLSMGMGPSGEIDLNGKKVKASNSLFLNLDGQFYNFELSGFTAGVGFTFSLGYLNYHLDSTQYVTEFGDEYLNFIFPTIGPSFFIEFKNLIGIYAAPIIGHSVIPYEFENSGHSQVFEGGILSGFSAGTYMILGDIYILLKIAQFKGDINSVYSFSRSGEAPVESQQKITVKNQSISFNLGLSF